MVTRYGGTFRQRLIFVGSGVHRFALPVVALLVPVLLCQGCATGPTLSAEHEQAASARSPVIGMVAPDFALPDQDERTVRLSDLRGQWAVLYFYPKDETAGCLCQATEFTEIINQFEDMNAAVVGVSADPPEVHRAFIQAHELQLTLLSDVEKRVMANYGASVTARLGEMEYDRVIRTTYIIDPQGVIRWHWPEVIPEGHAERVSERLEQLREMRGGGERRETQNDEDDD